MKNNKSLFIILVIIISIITLLFLTNTKSTKENVYPQEITKLNSEDFVSQYKQNENTILIDVRTPEEFQSGHIEGAINIDFNNQNFETQIQSLDPNIQYFVYCRSGDRSGQAISVMKKYGFQNILELKGGLASSQNIPLVKDI